VTHLPDTEAAKPSGQEIPPAALARLTIYLRALNSLMAAGTERISSEQLAESAGVSIPARAGLVAAFVGGMSGEYFYGGKPLLALFLVAAPILSLPFESSSQVRNNAHARIPHPASSVA
jgi:hypothetical protein